jgi:hypothetical protein
MGFRMRPLNADTLQLLDEGRASIRGLLRFDFGGGSYGFTTMAQRFTYNGLEYLPGGVIEVDAIPGSWGMNAAGLEISLASSRHDSLTPAALATIEDEDYHQRPVTISDAYFHPDTGALLFVEPVYRGFVDTVVHEDGPNGRLVINCESRALDNNREGYRLRSTADQQLISPGDRFFEHAEVAGKQEIFWGRERPGTRRIFL